MHENEIQDKAVVADAETAEDDLKNTLRLQADYGIPHSWRIRPSSQVTSWLTVLSLQIGP